MFTKHRLSLKPHNSSEKLPTVSRLKTRLCSLWIARRKKREARLNLYLMILNVQLCRRHKVNCKINRLNLKFFIIQVKACKFDFERGIGAWAKTGTAFNNQPTYGDNPTARNRGHPANQQGDWWIGGYENRPKISTPGGKIQGDRPQGTLTSPPFKINGKKVSFLIGGGCDIKSIRAELIIGAKVRMHR